MFPLFRTFIFVTSFTRTIFKGSFSSCRQGGLFGEGNLELGHSRPSWFYQMSRQYMINFRLYPTLWSPWTPASGSSSHYICKCLSKFKLSDRTVHCRLGDINIGNSWSTISFFQMLTSLQNLPSFACFLVPFDIFYILSRIYSCYLWEGDLSDRT